MPLRSKRIIARAAIKKKINPVTQKAIAKKRVAGAIIPERIKVARELLKSGKWAPLQSIQEFCRWLADYPVREGMTSTREFTFSAEWINEYLKANKKRMGFSFAPFVRNSQRDVTGVRTRISKNYKLGLDYERKHHPERIPIRKKEAKEVAGSLGIPTLQLALSDVNVLRQIALNRGVYVELLGKEIAKRLKEMRKA